MLKSDALDHISPVRFLINVFPLKDFLNSLLKYSPARITQIEKGSLDYRIDTLIVILDHSNLKINFLNKILISDLKKLFFVIYVCMGAANNSYKNHARGLISYFSPLKTSLIHYNQLFKCKGRIY